MQGSNVVHLIADPLANPACASPFARGCGRGGASTPPAKHLSRAPCQAKPSGSCLLKLTYTPSLGGPALALTADLRFGWHLRSASHPLRPGRRGRAVSRKRCGVSDAAGPGRRKRELPALRCADGAGPRGAPGARSRRGQLRVERRNQLWVADITYIPIWVGFLYVAFCARREEPPRGGSGNGDPICAPSSSWKRSTWRSGSAGRWRSSTRARAPRVRALGSPAVPHSDRGPPGGLRRSRGW